MEKFVRGIHQFQTTAFSAHRELFETLSQGQRPDTLLITCSDSRIAPELLPKVAALMAKGELTLHGWIYEIESGQMAVAADRCGRIRPP